MESESGADPSSFPVLSSLQCEISQHWLVGSNSKRNQVFHYRSFVLSNGIYEAALSCILVLTRHFYPTLRYIPRFLCKQLLLEHFFLYAIGVT